MKYSSKWLHRIGLVLLLTVPMLLSMHRPTKPAPRPVPNAWAEKVLDTLTLEEKIGQFFMLAAYPKKGKAHLDTVQKRVVEQNIGGIIWFQGSKQQYLNASKRMQDSAKIPLLYGMDAEWGSKMRLSDGRRMPYAYTIGAANDEKLTKRIASIIAAESRELGIHLNFGPVADVHSNPWNPVIGFRSFGENPQEVGNHVRTFVEAFEEQGIMSSIKHFPGHGDTETDSHLQLPKVNKSLTKLNAIDLLPFREGIRAGANSVMVGHLNVPALDPSGTPSSLSKIIIKEFLQEQMGFKGLVISDALNMKAVTKRYGKTEVVVKAFEAGCDILLFPESVENAIAAIKMKVENGAISMEEINRRCLEILKAKEKYVLPTNEYRSFSKGEIDWAKKECFEKATVLLKNEDSLLPLSDLSKRTLAIYVGDKSDAMQNMLGEFSIRNSLHLTFKQVEEGKYQIPKSHYERIVINVHVTTLRPRNRFGTPKKLQGLFDKFSAEQEVVLSFFGNPLILNNIYDFTNVDAVLFAYENTPEVQDRVAQMLVGAIPIQGELPFSVSLKIRKGAGITAESNGRLKFSQPEELGISREKLKEIDSIVAQGIAEKAFPGCQVVGAVEGKIFYRKSFGTKKYDTDSVENGDLYDIASITKIAASTFSLMHLQSNNQFSLDSNLGDFIPKVTKNTGYSKLGLREILAHQSGLKSWIPFYTKTLINGNWNSQIYASHKDSVYNKTVREGMYIKSSYEDEMYNRILHTPLYRKRYKYSDLGYYFIKKIIEKKTHSSMENYVANSFYEPMGLDRLTYLPIEKFPLDEITPTEDDKIYRKSLVHGYVHDPGAAMLGGVCGHAGIFSTATDLAELMQVYLNGGNYGGMQFIDAEVLAEYTKVQFPNNRRGAGFDKPKLDGGGTCDDAASQSSFGHSGFTGTLAWVDPKYKLNYVFLSNRVYPDAENWKILKLNTRTEIQRVLYEAVEEAENGGVSQ